MYFKPLRTFKLLSVIKKNQIDFYKHSNESEDYLPILSFLIKILMVQN